jgi:hypothetical protein
MSLLSVADACRRLGIDAKTLHRWLEEAHLPLQCHPHDGRKKGVSGEHLPLLAHLHQRQFAPEHEQPPVPAGAGNLPALPPELLALPKQLAALQTQIATLQQHVADLSRLLQSHEQASATRAASTKPTRATIRPSKLAPQVPRSRPTAKPPRKPVHVIPRVEYGKQGHYVVICPKHGVLPFEPDTQEWFAWVAEQDSFRFVGKSGSFTAHHEWRVPKGAWRAHRHIRNRNSVLRLAPNHELTIAVLEQAAEALQAHLT